ncbi:hypothetical protein [Chromatium okenii]|uniref:hypothetical protein n=1 Tax=Chromatium okenii TaxID=61644 RepID=UPI0026EC364E|nr:hypothetical protein [Chromatium okenii]MBV5311452.1 hypothetical protein [Chromatium okenii]
MKTLIHIGFSLFFLCSITTANAQTTLGGYTDKSAICADEKQAGVIAGDAVGYLRGIGEGTTTGTAQCFADPQSCNITLASCIPAAVYGETEPNDNMIAADPLLPNTSFWGQNYSVNDQDWFYTETTTANQNMLITFKSSGDLAGWLITIRDAAGSIFATFDTAVAGEVPTNENDHATTYRVTLGLIGTYYLMIQPKDAKDNFAPYSIAAVLQDSGLGTTQPVVGFVDAEMEPNDVPSKSNPLAPSVSMYGVINLMFNGVVAQGDQFVWGQGEPDWYVFSSPGNEIVDLTFCAKEKCGPGSWFVEIYDEATAKQLEAGQPRETLYPLLAVNTDTGDQEAANYRFGLKNPGLYYMQVFHKRLFSAPCAVYQADVNGDGGYDQYCSCSGGDYSCKTDIVNPAGLIDVPQYPTCPGSTDKSATCLVKCKCDATDVNGAAIGCITDGHDPIQCACPFNLASCDITIPNPQEPVPTLQYPLCPDGTGGGDKATCAVNCQCTEFGGTVEVPDGAITSQYNFTWFSTQLPPNTYDTDAYKEFLNRSNPYQ